jgi:hypothetical protein
VSLITNSLNIENFDTEEEEAPRL